MPAEPLEFAWRRPEAGGFTWELKRGRDPLGERLVLVEKPGTTYRRYFPLRERVALHRQLAGIEPTEGAILAFANRYGRLGAGAAHVYEGVECFSDWHRTIVWLHEAIRLWDLIAVGDTDALRRVIRWEGPLVHYYPPPDMCRALGGPPWEEIPAKERRYLKGYDILGSAPGGPEFHKGIRAGNVVRPATLFVHQLVNGEFGRLVGPLLVWDPKRNRTVRLDLPYSLLGAIYVQFAQEMQTRRTARLCPICGRYFDLARDAARTGRLRRSDRETCSDACRSKAYRDRKQLARALHSQGRRPKAIAKELGTTVAVVQTWLTSAK
jgi:hypothetical protein